MCERVVFESGIRPAIESISSLCANGGVRKRACAQIRGAGGDAARCAVMDQQRRHVLSPKELREACDAVTDAFWRYPHLSEAVYQRALQLELQQRGFFVVAEVVKPILYKGMHAGIVRADLVVHSVRGNTGNVFVLELKRAPKIVQSHIDQLCTYVALLFDEAGEPGGIAAAGAVVNFGSSPAEIHFEDTPRWAHSNASPEPSREHSRSRSRSRSPTSASVATNVRADGWPRCLFPTTTDYSVA